MMLNKKFTSLAAAALATAILAGPVVAHASTEAPENAYATDSNGVKHAIPTDGTPVVVGPFTYQYINGNIVVSQSGGLDPTGTASNVPTGATGDNPGEGDDPSINHDGTGDGAGGAGYIDGDTSSSAASSTSTAKNSSSAATSSSTSKTDTSSTPETSASSTSTAKASSSAATSSSASKTGTSSTTETSASSTLSSTKTDASSSNSTTEDYPDPMGEGDPSIDYTGTGHGAGGTGYINGDMANSATKSSSTNGNTGDNRGNGNNAAINHDGTGHGAGGTGIITDDSNSAAATYSSTKAKNSNLSLATTSSSARVTDSTSLSTAASSLVKPATNAATLPQTGESQTNNIVLSLIGGLLSAMSALIFGFGYLRKYKHFNK